MRSMSPALRLSTNNGSRNQMTLAEDGRKPGSIAAVQSTGSPNSSFAEQPSKSFAAISFIEERPSTVDHSVVVDRPMVLEDVLLPVHVVKETKSLAAKDDAKSRRPTPSNDLVSKALPKSSPVPANKKTEEQRVSPPPQPPASHPAPTAVPEKPHRPKHDRKDLEEFMKRKRMEYRKKLEDEKRRSNYQDVDLVATAARKSSTRKEYDPEAVREYMTKKARLRQIRAVSEEKMTVEQRQTVRQRLRELELYRRKQRKSVPNRSVYAPEYSMSSSTSIPTSELEDVRDSDPISTSEEDMLMEAMAREQAAQTSFAMDAATTVNDVRLEKLVNLAETLKSRVFALQLAIDKNPADTDQQLAAFTIQRAFRNHKMHRSLKAWGEVRDATSHRMALIGGIVVPETLPATLMDYPRQAATETNRNHASHGYAYQSTTSANPAYPTPSAALVDMDPPVESIPLESLPMPLIPAPSDPYSVINVFTRRLSQHQIPDVRDVLPDLRLSRDAIADTERRDSQPMPAKKKQSSNTSLYRNTPANEPVKGDRVPARATVPLTFAESVQDAEASDSLTNTEEWQARLRQPLAPSSKFDGDETEGSLTEEPERLSPRSLAMTYGKEMGGSVFT